MTTEGSLEKLPDYLLELAAEKRRDGVWCDGYAEDVEQQVACWRAGRAGMVPRCWLGHMQGFNKTLDPEYPEYVRLQKKFGGE